MQSRCRRKSRTDCNVNLISPPTAEAMPNGDTPAALAPSLQSDTRLIEVVSNDNRCPDRCDTTLAFGQRIALASGRYRHWRCEISIGIFSIWP